MQSDYMAIFKDICYDVQQDEEMNEVNVNMIQKI